MCLFQRGQIRDTVLLKTLQLLHGWYQTRAHPFWLLVISFVTVPIWVINYEYVKLKCNIWRHNRLTNVFNLRQILTSRCFSDIIFHLVCFQKEIVIFVNVTETPHGCSRGGVPLLPLATSVCFSPPALLCLLEQWSLDWWAAEWQLAPSTTTPRTTKEIQQLYFRNDKEQVILNNPMSGLCVVGVGRQIPSVSSLKLRGLTEYKKKYPPKGTLK